jgi:hypothetical protein
MIAAVAGGSASLVIALVAATRLVLPNHTLPPLLDSIRPGLDAGADLIAYGGGWLQSGSYYAARRIAVCEETGEMEFGAAQLGDEEHARWFGAGLDDVRGRLASARPVYCMVRDHAHAVAFVQRLGGGVREITWNKRRSIVGNAAAVALTPPVEGGLLGERRRRLR